MDIRLPWKPCTFAQDRLNVLCLKLAEEGDENAQFLLGRMYEQGTGVKRDEVEAVKWYRKAAARGHRLAEKEIKRRGLKPW